MRITEQEKIHAAAVTYQQQRFTLEIKISIHTYIYHKPFHLKARNNVFVSRFGFGHCKFFFSNYMNSWWCEKFWSNVTLNIRSTHCIKVLSRYARHWKRFQSIYFHFSIRGNKYIVLLLAICILFLLRGPRSIISCVVT